MGLEPTIKCSEIARSLNFYTTVLDFEVVSPPDPDPASFMSKYALLRRDGCLMHLSAHGGDGVFGNVVYVRVRNVDPLYKKFVSNGLNITSADQNPCLRIPLVEQTWGMKEFAVSDPDGNKLTFGHQLS